jgi:osomolarity two-component system, sensor histidine kinase SLN1
MLRHQLTYYFQYYSNEMSDELMMQYERLEERVQQRTAELELSKKAAEAANESKTLFIANISHELKTPLNGILGMCAVCMQEDDPVRLKRSLGIIYKSGDLLLNLLTDLLTFSKNQVGQHLTLDEKEFRLRDIHAQLLAIFEKQAREGNINLRVQYEGVQDSLFPEQRTEFGPSGTGRIKDMVLWGDTHRILQVLINLVSNALKFTPAGGNVIVTIRCLSESPELGSRKGSMNSRQSRQHSSRHKGSDATLAGAATANAINLRDKPNAIAHFQQHERAQTPPPGKYLYFEFEVKDTGPGISEALQSKIFEPFVQGDLGLSKKYGGTGLGLSICSQLASLMRGSIGVHSTLGQGSTFTMKIPIRYTQSRADSTASSSVDLPKEDARRRSTSLEDAERGGLARHNRHLAISDNDPGSGPSNPSSSSGTPNPPGDSQPRLVGLSQPFFAASQPMESPNSQSGAMEKITQDASHAPRIRVLVAEDNKVNQEVVLRMLKLEDIYDVTVAKDGQEALDRVKESMGEGTGEVKPYNLIFMDVQMPNVDGLQSTRLIREVGFQAPIVALTAFAEESNIKDCLESGMNYFL